MKKFSLLALAAAGLLFGACSEKDAVVNETDATNPYGLIEGESSWIAVGISMPGDVVTRGITRANEDLTDGDENEYAVKSGTLYLFKGENEDDATFFGSYPIPTAFTQEGNDSVPGGNSIGTSPIGNGEISFTSTAKIVQEIENPSLGINDKLYAYVILNNNNNVAGLSTIKKNSTDAITGKEFKELQLNAIGIEDETEGFGNINTSNGLVMTNVPIATVPGGDSDPTGSDITTFTEINKDAIYKTKAEAQADGAQTACIYVERAAVKVEVQLDNNFGIKLDGDNGKVAIQATDVQWALGNVNFGGTNGTGTNAITGVGYYNTRQFDKTWLPYNNLLATQTYLKYRMVGRTPFFKKAVQDKHTPSLAYRTYFGKDPNYTGTGDIPYDANTGLLNAQLSDGQYTLDPNDVTYTYENTFDENSQIYRNTTYVGVKVKIADGDFYTIEGQPNTKLADNTAIVAVVKTRLRDVINSSISAINTAINGDLAKTTANGRTISEGVTKVTYDISVTVNEGTYNDETGELPYTVTLGLTNVKTTTAGVESNASTNDLQAITTLAGNNIGSVAKPANSTVYKYKGGIAYYSTRIQHFGDVETPWSAPGEAYNNYIKVYPENGQSIHTTPVVYGANRANAWLGRWGIVRNNWYVLTLKEITGIGSPVPEDFNGTAGNTPDDNPKTSYFISAEVHIMPWVKRTQNVTF